MRTKTLGALALAGTMIGLVAGAGPSSAAPAEVTKSAVSGDGVIASFRQSSGCIVARATVLAQVNDTGENIATMTASVVDTCAQETLLQGFGASPAVDLETAPNLSSANLATAINFNNFVDGSVTSVPIVISFDAIGSQVTTPTVDIFKAEGALFQALSLSKAKPADAVGTFSIGGLLSFVNEPSVEATIATGSERTHTKVKNP